MTKTQTITPESDAAWLRRNSDRFCAGLISTADFLRTNGGRWRAIEARGPEHTAAVWTRIRKPWVIIAGPGCEG